MGEQSAAERIHQRAWTGQEPGLERIRRLLSRLGDPHGELKFVHIAGTNGKGSTAAMLASVLEAAGKKTGLYTSPHLWDFRERFQINGQPIPEDELEKITAQVVEQAEDETEFELMTAVGMVCFRQAACDIVVLETGLGGSLDPTNVIPPPEAAVITRIGLEHTQILGDTLGKIAAEKAGILKPGGTGVLCAQEREVMEVVEAACRARGVRLAVTAPEETVLLSSGLEGQRFTCRGKGPYRIALLGEHQLENAAVALETVNVLRRQGWDIPEEAVVQGLERTRWPGRLELVRRGPDLLLDGAHNPQCMEALARSLKQLYPGKRFTFLTGILADKDCSAMLAPLLPLAEEVFTLTPDSPRALSAEALAGYVRERGGTALPCAGVPEGLDRALTAAGASGVVCVCGSLYTIGEVRHRLGLC